MKKNNSSSGAQNDEISSQLEEISQQNEYIEQQRAKLEQHNQQITDSIRYARRIQFALLPPDDYVLKKLPDSFIYYKPKDIVSGDFYWLNECKGYLFFAVIDCTGHGVPGAMMSVIANNALNDLILHDGHTEPGQILSLLNRSVNQILRQENREPGMRDGMDMALLVIDQKNKTLRYSGAKTPLYLWRNNELEVIKAERASIGGGFQNFSLIRFEEHEIAYTPDTQFFLSTDGYLDQFGGEKGRKFMKKHFRNMLNEQAGQPISQIATQIDRTMKDWKAGYTQTDDMLVVGFSLNDE